MHVLINVKSPNNISKWQMGFNSAFKGLKMSLEKAEFVRHRRKACNLTQILVALRSNPASLTQKDNLVSYLKT
jgi:hypothetical protein